MRVITCAGPAATDGDRSSVMLREFGGNFLRTATPPPPRCSAPLAAAGLGNYSPTPTLILSSLGSRLNASVTPAGVSMLLLLA